MRFFLPRILAIFSARWVFSPSRCPVSSHASVPRKRLSLERLWTLVLPKCWPKRGRKFNCTTPSYNQFNSWIARFLGSRWGRKYGENNARNRAIHELNRSQLGAAQLSFPPCFGQHLRSNVHSIPSENPQLPTNPLLGSQQPPLLWGGSDFRMITAHFFAYCLLPLKKETQKTIH